MQDEVNEKTVSLCIRCGKVTANLLKAAMKKVLAKMEQEKQKLQGQKQPKSRLFAALTIASESIVVISPCHK